MPGAGWYPRPGYIQGNEMIKSICAPAQPPDRKPHEMPEFPELPAGLVVFAAPSDMAGEWLITEAEVAQQMRMPLKEFLAIVPLAEAAGLPLKDAIFDRRCRAAVEAWVLRRHGVGETGAAVPPAPGRGKF